MKRKRDMLLGATGLVAILAAGWLWLPNLLMAPNQRRLDEAEKALNEGDAQDAERIAAEVLESWPDSDRALLIAGRAALKSYRYGEAVDYLGRIKHDYTSEAVESLFELVQLFRTKGYLTAAENCCHRLLDIDPSHTAANLELFFLLTLEGRAWEAAHYAYRCWSSETHTPSKNELLAIGFPELVDVHEPALIALCLRVVPNDPIPLLNEVKQDLRFNRNKIALRKLDKIVKVRPEIIQAQANRGRLLLEFEEADEFLKWHRSLPAEADAHPDIWFVRGGWMQREEHPEAAARCYVEALIRSPNHVEANFQLSQVLAKLDAPQLQSFAKRLADRAVNLAELQLKLQDVSDFSDEDTVRRIVELLEQDGRIGEAAGWCQLSLQSAPTEWARDCHLRLEPEAKKLSSLNDPAKNPVRDIDVSQFPLPSFSQIGFTAAESLPESNSDAVVAFRDDAKAAGIEFTYNNGVREDAKREYLFQFDGGGVAILDYDGDGWPDIYLTQAGDWPTDPHQRRHVDHLFRNGATGGFDRVTNSSRLGDNSYSQGVTVGDFNQDGFPDLYVANVGANRLYENNGDGTFTDVTEQAHVGSQRWTSSCAFADFNNDGLPDLYAVNYVGGKKFFEHFCNRNDPVRCSPSNFNAEQDELFVNLGNGEFRASTDESGIVAPNGKGLGVVVADFDNTRRLSVFVANDSTPNFYFVNQTPVGSPNPVFTEMASLSGLAVDERGIAQACMGVAAGDANGDARLELFVTNFFNDSNTLYQQLPDGTFVDNTRTARLREASFRMLGFGAQFSDADLDGLPDLMLLNGHIYNRPEEHPYRMVPQFFRNVGAGRFQISNRLGPFFEKRQLGRSLARIDWNRDGLEDFCISHLDTLAALLTNRTQGAGNFLAVRLRATNSDRDAIGTKVFIKAGDRTVYRQLMAGDGYQSSNQRNLVFGLGRADVIDEMKVEWPSGETQLFRSPPVNSEIVLVEGRDRFFSLSSE